MRGMFVGRATIPHLRYATADGLVAGMSRNSNDLREEHAIRPVSSRAGYVGTYRIESR